jgi:hypothetical protein
MPAFATTTTDIGLQLILPTTAYMNGIERHIIGSGTSFPGYTILNEDDMVTVTLKAISLFGCKPDSMSRNFLHINFPIRHLP